MNPECCDKDPRTSEELIRTAVRDPESDAAALAVSILHRRGTRKELTAATRLAGSRREAERIVAARVLGQLGRGKKAFDRASGDCLIQLLGDKEPAVVGAAAVALAHRDEKRALPALVKLRGAKDPRVRYGVAVALGGHDEEQAVETLLELSRDGDRDVRSWATLGLGTLVDTNTRAVQRALLERAMDEDAEVRGEALIGLARRRHPEAVRLVRAELDRPFSGDWVVEAAETLGDDSLHEPLCVLWNTLPKENRSRFASAFARAKSACTPREG